MRKTKPATNDQIIARLMRDKEIYDKGCVVIDRLEKDSEEQRLILCEVQAEVGGLRRRNRELQATIERLEKIAAQNDEDCQKFSDAKDDLETEVEELGKLLEQGGEEQKRLETQGVIERAATRQLAEEAVQLRAALEDAKAKSDDEGYDIACAALESKGNNA